MAGDIRNLTGMPTGGVGQFRKGAIPGQPTYVRTWGIPTGPGWRIGPGKWNAFIPHPVALVALAELARKLLQAIWEIF